MLMYMAQNSDEDTYIIISQIALCSLIWLCKDNTELMNFVPIIIGNGPYGANNLMLIHLLSINSL